MATFSFFAGENTEINNLSGSGLGFYGDDGFGASIAVGSYNGRTFITDSTGVTQGPEADNCKLVNAGSGILGQVGSGISLTCIPNERATLRVDFTHSTAVTISNARCYGYDRVDYRNAPSGVTLKGAELIHPGNTQTNEGSGDSVWTTLAGSGSYLTLANSPGPSGLFAGNGSNSTYSATQHSWFLALSASPDSVGSKTFGIYFSCEYS